ncbi:MAG: SsrA-binding protein SmpB [Kiloniellales bacterium]
MTAAPGRIVAQNRKARHDYLIGETVEAGLVLVGTEVKSLRAGSGSIAEAYAGVRNGELHLLNAYIPEYKSANRFNHEPRRPRKLLVHRRERNRLAGAVQRRGVTLVPLALYFNDRGIAKLRLGLATGKRKVDKRATEKARDWQRQKQRLMRERG